MVEKTMLNIAKTVRYNFIIIMYIVEYKNINI